MDRGLVRPLRNGLESRYSYAVKLFDPVPLRILAPNAVTASSMVVGLGSIAYSMHGEFWTAAWLIAVSVLLDKLDGAVARWLGASTEFGVQFDSLSDLITFGLAPAALLFCAAPVLAPASWGPAAGPLALYLLAGLSALHVVGAAVRLAKFNVTTNDHPTIFMGLPSTLSGGLLASGFLTVYELGYQSSEAIFAIFPWWMAINAALMVCNLPLPKFRVSSRPWLRAFTLVNVVAVYMIVPMQRGFTYLLLLTVVYLVIGTAYALRQGATQGPAAAPLAKAG